MNYGITPEQASQIVSRLANSGNNPAMVQPEFSMPYNDQFFNMNKMSASVDFMSDPRYQPVNSGLLYSPMINQAQAAPAPADNYANFGPFADVFRSLYGTQENDKYAKLGVMGAPLRLKEMIFNRMSNKTNE